MRNRIIFFFLLVCISSVNAQQKKNWYLLPQVGLLNGPGKLSYQGMLTGGIVKNGWDIGLGAGIDYYSIRTVPVVADIRKSIAKLPLFGYANIGYNIVAPLDNQYVYPYEGWGHSKSSFSNGWLAEGGLGYDMMPQKSSHRLYLIVGYSIKTVSEHYTETIPRDFPPYYGEVNEHTYSYQFNRFVLKLGFRL